MFPRKHINSLWHSDPMWWYKTGSTMVHLLTWLHQATITWTNVESSPVTFVWGQFYKRYHRHQYLMLVWKFHSNLPRANELKCMYSMSCSHSITFWNTPPWQLPPWHLLLLNYQGPSSVCCLSLMGYLFASCSLFGWRAVVNVTLA